MILAILSLGLRTKNWVKHTKNNANPSPASVVANVNRTLEIVFGCPA